MSKYKIGDISKNVKILDIIKGSAAKHKLFYCECLLCGNRYNVTSSNFSKGKQCKCRKHLYNDLTGRVFGKIIVNKLIQRALDREGNGKKTGHLYECSCLKCGKKKNVSSVVISRKGFLGCRCPDDLTLASKKALYAIYRTGAFNRNLEFTLSIEEFIKICEKPCYYTGAEKSMNVNRKDLFGEWSCNGIDRLDNKKGYTIENSVPCSSETNRMKGTLTEKEFLNIIKLIYEKRIK